VTDLFELGLRNRRAVPFAAVPVQPVDGFGATLADARARGCRLVSLFGLPDGADRLRLVAIVADDAAGALGVTSAVVARRYPTVTPHCPQAARFEREIREQCAAVADGHPALKPVRRHPPDHAPTGWSWEAPGRDQYPFDRVEGDEVHEVAVGPVHAGIIEPGHFRFQAHGERVLELEIMLGYQHRGVERLLETGERARTVLVAESIAGDTVVGHADAYCGALEALARCRKTPRAQAIRGLALELERLANHVGDLGALAGDVAYQPGAAYFGRLRGEFLNLLMAVSGNRFGRGLLRPGGVQFDLTADLIAELRDRLAWASEMLDPVARLMFAEASVQARFEGVGVVDPAVAEREGFVGPVARACEIPRDVRHDHPWGVFRFAHVPVATAWAGDVFARAQVRRLETQRSLEFLQEQLDGVPKGAPRVPAGALRPDELVVSLVEGWRGEIAHVVITDARGGVRRHKVTDPSFHNWPALAAAMSGNEMSDFPLCNKSFNLSYAGHDL
jgi:Ni,Fe-hydrogenase III large subunit